MSENGMQKEIVNDECANNKISKKENNLDNEDFLKVEEFEIEEMAIDGICGVY